MKTTHAQHAAPTGMAGKRFTALAAAIALSLTLSACGSDSSPTPAPTPSPTPTPTPTPSPGVQPPSFNTDYLNRSIKDDVFYFVMVDRFANGDATNDQGSTIYPESSGGFDPTNKGFYHGGDLAGLTDKLDYIKTLGATAIWLTPILRNQAVQGDSAGYHGYWTLDFTQIDPHFGSNQALKEFIDAAHAKGIKVFFDIITNHTADVIRYEECHNPDGSHQSGDSCAYKSLADVAAGDTYTPFLPAGAESIKVPAWLNDTQHYHNQGDSTFSGENSLNGDFFGLDDVNTESPEVVAGMIDIFKNIITEFKPDGFRVDTVKHVNIEFWQAFGPAIEAHAHDAGIPQFGLFGEVFEANPATLSRYTTEGKLPSVLDFNLKSTAGAVFSGQASASALAEVFAKDDLYNDADSNADLLMNFISNHDDGRFGHHLMANLNDASDAEKQDRLALANAFLFFARGVPVIYYGDEQGFTGDGGDKDAREDMMPSLVADYNDNTLIGSDASTAEDNFNQEHPLYATFNGFAHVYHANEGLRQGVHQTRAQTNDNLYVFSRTLRNEQKEYLVAFNPTNDEQSTTVAAVNGEYALVHHSSDADASGLTAADNQLTLTIPARSFVIYKAANDLPTASAITASIDGITSGGIAAGTVTLNVTPDNSEALAMLRVATEIKLSEGDWQVHSDDYTAPYSARIDTSDMPNGTALSVRVSVVNSAGEMSSTVIPVTVENRLPSEVALHYQNDNNRTHFFAIDDQGGVHGPYAYTDGTNALGWPTSTDNLLLVFASQMPNSDAQSSVQSLWQYDEPVRITREQAVSLAEETDEQTLRATLYINGDKHVSASAQPSGAAKALAADANTPAPFPDSDNDGNANNDLYVRGAINGWGVDDPMQYLGYGMYQRTISVTKGDAEFKFADANWSPTNIGAPVTANGLTASSNPGNLLQHFPVSGMYDFFIQKVTSGDNEFIIPLVKQNYGKFGEAMFVRGSMNGWQALTDYQMAYQGKNLTGADYYYVEMTLNAGSYEFKIANHNWQVEQATAEADHPEVLVGTQEALTASGGANMTFSTDVDAVYRFTMTANDANADSYGLLVELVQVVGEDTPPLSVPVHLKGELDGWAAGVPFDYVGGGKYALTVYADADSLAAQANQNDDGFWDFKIADENWSVVNLGGPTTPELQLGTQVTLSNGGDSSNLALPIANAAGLYTFTLDASDASAYKLTVEMEAAQQAKLHYYRADGDYQDWGLHLWGDDLHQTVSGQISWTNPWPFQTEDSFGKVSSIYLAGTSAPLGLIVHKGDEKDPGPDMSIDITQQLEYWMNSGDATLYLTEEAALAARQ